MPATGLTLTVGPIRTAVARWDTLHTLVQRLEAAIRANAQIDAAILKGLSASAALRHAARTERALEKLAEDVDAELSALTSELLRAELKAQMKADHHAKSKRPRPSVR